MMSKQTPAPVKHADGEKELERLTHRIAELETALRNKEEDYKRALADYRNLERRTEEDRQRMAQFASIAVLEELIVPIDHLELAAQHIKNAGLEMVVKQFRQSLKQLGVQELDVLGKPFDPKTMEAAESVPGKEGLVVGVQRKGYTLNGIVLRHARVSVGNGVNQSETEDKQE